jgi:hypothetical protein
MRKHDVFGRRISQVRFVYLMIAVFIAVLSTRFIILSIQSNRLNALLEQESQLQSQIDAILSENEADSYHEIAQIIPFLPNEYQPILISNDLEIAKNLSGLSMATNYQTEIDQDAVSPFDFMLASSVKFVHISLEMNIEDATSIFDFIDNLLALDRLFHIDELSISMLDGGGAVISMSLYTFYNDVNI